MKNILVLCTGNSCRSQIAHGFLTYYTGGTAQIYSAGIETHGVNPRAVAVLAEVGIDIGHHTSNHVDEYQHVNFDLILTVCDHAHEHCPFIPSKKAVRLHQNFSDPSKINGSEEEIMKAFRQTRDAISTYCQQLVKEHLN
jgi:arsenate reductase